MASATYPLRALVLRKTKLGETDLILTLLAEDGRQVRVVAKGARKPSSSFSSRLETFCEVDVLLVRGKSLDIVKEARLLDAHMGAKATMEHAAAAAPVADLMARLSQPGLEAPKLFSLTSSALSHIDQSDESEALALCAACMLKAFAFAGVRPHLAQCVACGKPLEAPPIDFAGAFPLVSFSAAEGGVVCQGCSMFSDTVRISAETLLWAHKLLMATFDEIGRLHVSRRVSFDVLHLCQIWIREHVGTRLKSLEFLFTCGLF